MTECIRALPTPRQLEFLDWEMGVFFHFGIRTFYEGHRDWDMQPMAPEAFAPDALDCGQWLRTAADAGARYAVLVAKHHDGFANWPSAYTAYSVAATPWKQGRGDVVAEFVAACRQYGLKVGIYYSPAEFEMHREARSHKDYDDYFISQISELLSGYGVIDYLWFDGCGSEGHTYDQVRIVSEIRRLQPDILIFNMWDPDTRWIGNEMGLAPMPNYNTVSTLPFSVQTQDREALEKERFLPGECDFRLREAHWFYSGTDAHTLKSVEELMGIYLLSVGRGSNFLVNIAPDRQGLLPEADAARLIAFGREVQRRFSQPLAAWGPFERGETLLHCPLAQPERINCICLTEDLTEGECIRRYSVRAVISAEGDQVLLAEGYQVGHKAILSLPDIRVWELTICLEAPEWVPRLTSVAVFRS